jgi:hypothetical protein
MFFSGGKRFFKDQPRFFRDQRMFFPGGKGFVLANKCISVINECSSMMAKGFSATKEVLSVTKECSFVIKEGPSVTNQSLSVRRRRSEAGGPVGRIRTLSRRSAAVSQRPAAAWTNVAKALDLADASLLAKRLRLIPRGAGHSRAPGAVCGCALSCATARKGLAFAMLIYFIERF